MSDSETPPIFIAALEALRRARQRAIATARATNTRLVVVVDGQVVLVSPDELAK